MEIKEIKKDYSYLLIVLVLSLAGLIITIYGCLVVESGDIVAAGLVLGFLGGAYYLRVIQRLYTIIPNKTGIR